MGEVLDGKAEVPPGFSVGGKSVAVVQVAGNMTMVDE